MNDQEKDEQTERREQIRTESDLEEKELVNSEAGAKKVKID